MKNKLTPFEEHMKEKMNGHEAPYDSKSWSSVQSGLNRRGLGGNSWIFAAVSAALVIGAGIGYALHQRADESQTTDVPATHIESPINNTSPSETPAVSVQAEQTSTSDLLEPSSSSEKGTSVHPALNEVLLSSDGMTSTDTGNSGNGKVISSQEKNPQAAGKDEINLTLATNVRSACAGVDIDFQAANGPKSGSYLWNFGDGHFSDEINPKHKFAKSGTYDVSLSVTSDNGQINTTMINDMITIEEAPVADFTWEFINENPLQPEVKIIDLSQRANSYHWKSGSQQCNTPSCVFSLKGKETVSLEVTNVHGCRNQQMKSIAILSGEALGATEQLKVGKETFMPKKLKQQGVKFSLVIYNASNEVVFTSSSKNKAWDGKSAPEGTYHWKAIVEGLSNDPEYYSGSITLAP
jgi:PKD repeat protein